MVDQLDSVPTGSLDDEPSQSPPAPLGHAVLYALEPKGVPSEQEKEEDSSNFWNRLPFLRNRKKKK